MGHVDADHPPVRADPRGRQKAIEPGPAAEVYHHLAGPQRRDGLRVAAAKTEIGAVRHRCEFLGGVAHFTGLGFGGRGAGATG
jgi:hypothetical protein